MKVKQTIVDFGDIGIPVLYFKGQGDARFTWGLRNTDTAESRLLEIILRSSYAEYIQEYLQNKAGDVE